MACLPLSEPPERATTPAIATFSGAPLGNTAKQTKGPRANGSPSADREDYSQTLRTMFGPTLAAPVEALQPHCSQPQTAVSGRLATLKTLPKQWRCALLAIGRNKQPIDDAGRCLNAWLTSPVPSMAQLLRAPAVGLRTGQISQTLCLDFDGPEAWETFREVFGGDAERLLPRSVAWTSGKPGRCQVAFHIPASAFPLLEGKRRKIGSLELRWEGAQSVLLGHHPETGSYRWMEGKAPWQCELATFPLELLALVPAVNARPTQVGRHVAPHVVASPHVAGLVVPLEQFITLRSRWLIENGSAEGQCNADAIALSMDLVAAEEWVKTQGGRVERTAQELFDDYCRQCPDRINGRPFDQRAMQARFDGAVKRCPAPPTPEQKLRERLDFHRRMASRTSRRAQEVA